MRLYLLLLVSMSLIACSESYRDLERAFGQDTVSDTKPIPTDTFYITSINHPGVTNFHGIATVRLLPGKIELTTGAPFMRSLSIPVNKIQYCGMTCFGTDDPRVDLLIPSTGTNITIKNKEEMLDWCWNHKKAIISGEDERNWEYKSMSLPPKSKYADQLKSRKSFDNQAYQSCLGY